MKLTVLKGLLAAARRWPPPLPCRSRRPSSSGRTSTRPREPYHTVVGVGRRGDQEAHQRQVTRSRSSRPRSLGKETDINQGLTLGTVDIIITGASFAARSYPRLGVTYYPFIFRDADHLLDYGKSDVFKELTEGYRRQDRQPDHRATPTTARATPPRNKPFTNCAGMKGLKIRVPDVPAYRAMPRGLRRQPDADRLRRGLPGAAERHRRRAGEPAADHRGEEVLRGAEEHHADRPHRRRLLTTQVAPHVWNKLSRRREEDLHRRDAGSRRASATARSRSARRELVDEFKKKGNNVRAPVDRHELPRRGAEEQAPSSRLRLRQEGLRPHHRDQVSDAAPARSVERRRRGLPRQHDRSQDGHR